MWSLPGLTIAAQAFLFSTGLAPDTRPAGRIVIALVGLVTVVATATVMWEQARRLQLLRLWLQDRVPSVTSDVLHRELGRTRSTAQASAVKVAWAFVLAFFFCADFVVGAAAVAELCGSGDLFGTAE